MIAMPVELLYILPILAILALVLVVVASWLGQRRKQSAVESAARNEYLERELEELNLDGRMGAKKIFALDSMYPDVKINVAYRQIGEGPDLLCLHGIAASMMIYRRLVPLLSNTYRVTCIDFPGFGSSDKPETFSYSLDEQATHLLAITKALKLDRPLVLASSMGGAISLKAAVDDADAFRGLFAMAPAVDPRRIPSMLLPLTRLNLPYHRAHSPALVRTVVNKVISRREIITPALLALYGEPYVNSAASVSALLKAFRLLADRRMPSVFRELRTPLLILRGLTDRLVKHSSCENLRRVIPRAKFVTHQTAGHHIMEDEPEFTAEEVRKFDASLV